jgi:hypothetical protein
MVQPWLCDESTTEIELPASFAALDASRFHAAI